MVAIEPELRDGATSGAGSWVRVLGWLAGTVAAIDVVFFVLIRTVVPPLAVGVVLTAVGLALLGRRRRAGIVVLGLTTLVLLVGNLPFAVDHLAHPASPLDFVHAVAGTVGRALALVAVVGAWRAVRGAPGSGGARRLAAVSVTVASLSVVVAGIASVLTTGDDAAADDVPVTIQHGAFDDPVVVQAGRTVFADNLDVFRHTFTVEGTGIDVELPASTGVRIPIDLAPGTYELICAVPGHEFMTATLEVD